MTLFAVWAPDARTVEVDTLGRRLPLARSRIGHGWWEVRVPEAHSGTDYAFSVDGGDPTPDPRSRWQPQGVHGPSRVYEDTYAWGDSAWTGRQLAGSIIYEMHVGTFTPEGTFDAAIEKLDALVELGISTVEVMPVAAFPGTHGWGYDGVHLYAVHEPYGGPDAFKRFVDAAHQKGLAVLLDCVYNHLGPSGNYLSVYGPYFTGLHSTPWGDAVNLDDRGSDDVRRWIIDNARQWLDEFHVDGLRLDAVHALVDETATHLLAELAAEVDRLSAHVSRPLTLIAESDRNDASFVTPREAGGYGLTAQWDDDVHHALHTLLTGESQGYYGDFAEAPARALTAVLTGAFFHAGTWSSFRGRVHGAPVDTARIPAYRFVAYTQTHDQVGNRATGDRLAATLSDGRLKIGAALVLTSPFTPMLFMGEEYAASTPWQYFTDHQEPELAEAVRQGRRHEFAEHGWSEDEVPDPQDSATRDRSVLDWSEREKDRRGLLAWYRALIEMRRTREELTDPRLSQVHVGIEEGPVITVDRGKLRVIANLAAESRTHAVGADGAALLLASEDGVRVESSVVTLPAESVAVVELGPLP